VPEVEDDNKQKLKVSMVSWDSSDKWVITAVSDHTLKVWNSETGEFAAVSLNALIQVCCCPRCIEFSYFRPSLF
jgi:WD40 repeat protein